MTKSDVAGEIGMHVFERAGLGKAPFRCIGCAEVFFQAHPDAPRQCGGSCDFCGTGIVLQCKIKSADGRTFKVGADCVAKTGDAGLIRSFKTRPEVRKIAKMKAAAKDDAVRAEWKGLFEANEAKLSALFVPGRPWVPGEQITLFESLKRVWGMCGAAGRKRTLKTLKWHLKEESK